MTDDDLLTSLRLDWRQQVVSPDALACDYARARQRARLSIIAGAIGAAAVLTGLIALAWSAIARQDLLFAIAASAFAVALPLVLVGLVALGRQYRLHYEDTPLGLLVEMRDRTSTALRGLWGARACAGILVLAAAALWPATAAGYATVSEAVTLSAAWGSTAVLVWLWQQKRARHLANEAARLEALIAEFEAASRGG